VDFSQIIKESHEVTAEDFVRLVDDVIDLICNEQGNVGNFVIEEKLIRLAPVGEALVIGDLHGSLKSLSAILKKSRFIEKLAKDKAASVVFLGDYGDRGAQSPELYYCVLSLKRAFPKQVIFLRGNHEGPRDVMASPHDLPIMLQRKFKEKWIPIYAKVREFFDCLYNAVYVEERYLMLHGGLPVNLCSLQEIAQASELHPGKPFLEEILWNDPDDFVNGVYPSSRGAGNTFGKTITQTVLERINAKILIRGHEVANEGFKINHDGKILTLFSCRGEPYFTAHGAFLVLPLAERFNDANQLLPYIQQF
jgi:protein phosphatase